MKAQQWNKKRLEEGKMRQPRGIIFDYGNTLLDEDYFDQLAGNRRMLEFADREVKVTAEEVLKESNRLAKETNAVRNNVYIEFTNRNFQKTLFENLGIKIRLTPEEMEREFWRAAEHFSLNEGIIEVLDWIKARGIRLGIISNCSFGETVMWENLIDYKLSPYFEFLMSSADYGFRKPHPRIFETALRKMGLTAAEVWMVGDNLECDILGAQNYGLYPVWYNRLHQLNTHDYAGLQVDNWKDFLEILQTTKF
jgi:putative hydrolase of the HAD superfamily